MALTLAGIVRLTPATRVSDLLSLPESRSWQYCDRFFDFSLVVQLRRVTRHRPGLERIAAHGTGSEHDQQANTISGKFPHWTDADRSEQPFGGQVGIVYFHAREVLVHAGFLDALRRRGPRPRR